MIFGSNMRENIEWGGEFMAEYNMTYDDVKKFIDKSIECSENKDNLSRYKAEILAALTAYDSIY